MHFKNVGVDRDDGILELNEYFHAVIFGARVEI
jgi:hypothetical protein